jgi:hypothetical protein
VSDYRDDRGALRQRVEALEAELEKSQARVADLETDLAKVRGSRDEPEPKPSALPVDKRHTQLLAGFGAVAVLLGGLGIVAVLSPAKPTGARHEEQAAVKVATPLPKPASTPTVAPWVASSSCHCSGTDGESVALVYRAGGAMSFGGNSTYFLNAAFRAGELDMAIALGLDTVPPSKLEGGDTRLLLGCTQERMVLAFGHRVSAWGLGDGKVAWSATLPAPVGQGKNGPLRIECDALDVKDEVIAIPHAGGTAKLSVKDGSLVKTSGGR